MRGVDGAREAARRHSLRSKRALTASRKWVRDRPAEVGGGDAGSQFRVES